MTKSKRDINFVDIAILVVGIILSLLAIFELGPMGRFIKFILMMIYGKAYWLLIVTFLLIYFSLVTSKNIVNYKFIIGLVLLNFGILLLFTIPFFSEVLYTWSDVGDFVMNIPTMYSNFVTKVSIEVSGGIVGLLLYVTIFSFVEKTGTIIIAVALVFLSALLLVNIETYKNLFNGFVAYRNKRKEKKEHKKQQKTEIEINDEEEEYVSHKNKSYLINLNDTPTTKSDETNEKNINIANHKYDYKSYRLPSLGLLDPKQVQNKNNKNDIAAKEAGKKVIEILNNFGIKSQLINTHIGPSVTKFEIKPDSTIKVSKINNLQDNIKMELAARNIRIEAPISGRNAVGIEIPNVESIPVKMIELMRKIPSNIINNNLVLALGKDLMGNVVYCELDKMPHLLVAGATGSGKSVCMNTIITSLLLRVTPQQVKLLLIDPKKVEFTPYKNIPHLIGPVISDANEADNALKVVVTIMEQRYDLFAKHSVRNIKSYNDFVEQSNDEILKKLPFIVVIIDELADLMAIAGNDVEMSIQRITQLARASGIHLIVATQRPSTDVITGIIKSNIPSRISFSVASGIDSRTILDSIGAERLLGNGDMLYYPTGEPSPIRLQGVYVSDNEVSSIANHVSKQAKPFYEDAFLRLENLDSQSNNGLSVNDDPMYDEIKNYVIEQQKASTSLLQRRFGIGYNRAARMIDVLEDNGVIGPINGSKPREVYIKNN